MLVIVIVLDSLVEKPINSIKKSFKTEALYEYLETKNKMSTGLVLFTLI